MVACIEQHYVRTRLPKELGKFFISELSASGDRSGQAIPGWVQKRTDPFGSVFGARSVTRWRSDRDMASGQRGDCSRQRPITPGRSSIVDTTMRPYSISGVSLFQSVPCSDTVCTVGCSHKLCMCFSVAHAASEPSSGVAAASEAGRHGADKPHVHRYEVVLLLTPHHETGEYCPV